MLGSPARAPYPAPGRAGYSQSRVEGTCLGLASFQPTHLAPGVSRSAAGCVYSGGLLVGHGVLGLTGGCQIRL